MATEAEHPKLADFTNVDIANPRIKRHMNANNINRVIDSELAKWQNDFSTFQSEGKEDSERTNDFERRIEALRSERRHISADASRILSVVCNEMVRQLLCHGMDQLKDGHGLVTIKHLHTPGFENLGTYPLFRTLKSWASQETTIRITEQLAARDTEIARLTKELNRANKRLGKDAVEAAEDEEDVEGAAEEVDDENSNVVNFRTYVGHLYTRLKQDAKYENARCANKVREYLSDIIVEFLDRVSPMFSIMLAMTRTHTVSDRVVMSVLQMLLTDGQTVDETFAFRETKVDHPDDRKKTKKDGPRRQIPGYMMVREFGFKDDRFAPINELVEEKLGLFTEYSTKHKRTKAAPGEGKKEAAPKPKAKTAAAKPKAGKAAGKKPTGKPAGKAAGKATAGKKAGAVKPKNGAGKRPAAKA